jgi:hypothetical protein
LEILSLARNQLKKIENLDAVAGTLKQLWLSYNNIVGLAGVEKLQHLEVLYLSNNKVNDVKELDRLAMLPKFIELVFHGNSWHTKYLSEGHDEKEYRLEIIKRCAAPPRAGPVEGGGARARGLTTGAMRRRPPPCAHGAHWQPIPFPRFPPSSALSPLAGCLTSRCSTTCTWRMTSELRPLRGARVSPLRCASRDAFSVGFRIRPKVQNIPKSD